MLYRNFDWQFACKIINVHSFIIFFKEWKWIQGALTLEGQSASAYCQDVLVYVFKLSAGTVEQISDSE